MERPAPTPPTRRLAQGFEALRIRNYRIYFASLAISVSGTWMQVTALGWLIVQLSGDALALGTAMALQYAPVLLFGAWGGALVDRVEVRSAVLWAQATAGVLALVLFGLAAAGLASMPAIYLIALLMGFNGVVDNPARRAFVPELVPKERIASAVGLSGVLVNTSRVVGPALAAGIIAVAGTTICFLINGLSYFAVVAAILAMRRDELIPRPPRRPGPVRVLDTLRYVAGVPVLRRALVSVTIVSTFALNMPVVLPLFAVDSFGGDGSTYGILLAVTSVGGVVGAILTASVNASSRRWLEGSLLATGVAMTLAALSPSLSLAMATLALTGMTTFVYITTVTTSVQVTTQPEHRGRVLALWSMAFFGTTMIGAPIVGWITATTGPRAGLAAGAAACVVAAVVCTLDRRVQARSRRAEAAPA